MSDSDEIRHGSDLKRSDLQVGSLDLGIPDEDSDDQEGSNSNA